LKERRQDSKTPPTTKGGNIAGKVPQNIKQKEADTMRITLAKKTHQYRQDFNIETADDLRKVNEFRGGHFFDRDTMRGFNSRLLDAVYIDKRNKRGFFITSEKMNDETPRKFTLRFMLLNKRDAGTIYAVSPDKNADGFEYFETGREARAMLKKIKAGKVEFSALKDWSKADFPKCDLLATIKD